MRVQTQRKLVKRTSRVVDIGQANGTDQIVRNCLGYIAFSPSLKGRLLQKQARRVIKILF